MEFFAKNLIYLRKQAGKNQAEMSTELGFSTRSRIANYESGNSKPGIEDLTNIAKHFKIAIDDILNTDLSVKKTSVSAKTDSVKVKADLTEHQDDQLRYNCYYVPIKAFGGFLNGYDKPYYLQGLQKFPVPFIIGECFCFEVDGFSMADEYLPNDKVYCTVVDKVNDLIKGKDYVVQTTEGIIIKKFEGYTDSHLKLRSINPDPKYAVKPMPLEQVTRVYFIEEHLRKPNKS